MRRAERLIRGARVSVRWAERLVSGEIRSDGVVVDDQRYFEISLDSGEERLIAESELTPDLISEERPDAEFIQWLAQHREGMLNELVENVLEKLGQLYDQDIHLIEELIQNAEDAESSVVTFSIADDTVIARNNGLPFSRSDIDTITWVVRERSKAPGKIGRHGIGFRSVYALTERPSIKSGNVAFAIEQGLVPRLLGAPTGVDGWGTTFELPYRTTTAKNGQPYPQYFADQLQHFNVRTLLFLRNIWQLSVESTTDPVFALSFIKTEEPIDVPGGAAVQLYRGADSVPVESWLLFRDPPSGQVEDAVELAFRTEAGELAPCIDGVLHVFLPTRIRTHLPFLVSGDFTPNKSRNAIIDDDAHNSELLRRAGALLASTTAALISKPIAGGRCHAQPVTDKVILSGTGRAWDTCILANCCCSTRVAEHLREIGSDRTRLLEVLPLREHADPPVLQQLIEAAHAGLREKEIVPICGGGWATPQEALLLRHGDRPLADLLTAEDLAFVFGQTRSIVEIPAGHDVHARQLLDELGVQTWGYEHLRTLLTAPERLRGRQPTWFARLYAYLHTCPKVLREELRNVSLILCEDGELRSAEDKVLLPLAQKRDRDVYELFGDRYILVHQAVIWPEEAAEHTGAAVALLRELGLEQLSYIQVIEKWVLPAFTADPRPDERTLDGCMDFLRRRLEQYRRERLDEAPGITLEQALEPVRKGLRLRGTSSYTGVPPDYLEPGKLVLADAYRDHQTEAGPPRVAGIREVDHTYLQLGLSGTPKKQLAKQSALLKAAWREFLLAVGVQDTVDPMWVIEQVIKLRYRSEEWKTLKVNDLLEDLNFVRRHARQYQEWARSQQPPTQRSSYSAYRELGRVLYVRTKRTENNTNYYDYAPNLYLPTEARIQADIEALFPPSVVPPGRFIHSQYFKRKPAPDEVSWPEFFEALGAANRVRMVPIERKQGEYTSRDVPIWQDPRRQEHGYPPSVRQIGGIKDDWAAPDLDALFKLLPTLAHEERVRVSKLAFEILDAGWARGDFGQRYSSKLNAKLQYDQPYERYGIPWQSWHSWPWPSEFHWRLRKTAWLPDTEGQLHIAEELFANTADNWQLIGSVRPLLAFEIPAASEVAAFLRLDREPPIEAILDRLSTLAHSGAAADLKDVRFIYEHLAGRLNRDYIALTLAYRRFAEEALLYVPGDSKPWRSAGAVFFTGPRDVFAEHRAYLKPHYPGLWPLFRALEIEESPTVADYLSFVAKDLAAEPEETRLALAARCWVAASRLIQDEGGPVDPDEAAALRALPCLVAEEGSLHRASDIWLNDDPIAHAALREVLPILALPADVPLADVRPLLEWLHVQSLALSVRRTLASQDTGHEAPKIQRQVRGVVEFVQRWLFHRDPTRHDAAMNTGTYDLIASLRVSTADDLAVTYETDAVAATTPAQVVLLGESEALYCRPETPVQFVALELARLFGSPDGLAEFLMIALSPTSSPSSLAGFLELTGARALPPTARRWQPEEDLIPATPDGYGDGKREDASAGDKADTSNEVGTSSTERAREPREMLPGATYGERIAAELARGTSAAETEEHQYGSSLGLPIEAIFEQGETKVEEVRRRIQRRIEEDRTKRQTAPRQQVTQVVTGRQLVSELRAFLLERYQGRCQICSDIFRSRNGDPFFITHHLLPFAQDGFDSEANVLCLCPKHSAMLHHARCRLDLEQVSGDPSPGEDGFVRVGIEMDGKLEQIAFTPDHHWPFAELCRMPVPVAEGNSAG